MKHLGTIATDTPTRARTLLGAMTIALFAVFVPVASAAPPPAPQITAPAAATTYTNSNSITVSGTSAAGTTVSLYNLTPSTTLIAGSLPVTAGHWTYNATLAVGTHLLAAQATNGSGTSSPSNVVAIVVDKTKPDAPMILGPTGTAGTPAYLNTTTPLIQGFAEPNTTVRVYDGVTLIATTTAAVTGEWSVATSSLAQGSHTLRSTATDLAGNASDNSGAQFVVIDTIAPPAPTITTPTGATAFVGGTSTTIAGAAEANSTVTLYNNGNPLASALATTGTAWSHDATLGAGENIVLAWAVDRAGNLSAASAAKGIIVDSTPPTVNIISPVDGSETNNTAPAFVFDFVELYPAAVECRVNSGTWNACGSGIQLASLAEGEHTFSVRVRDLAGNQSTAATTFTVDYTAPAAPTITTGPDPQVPSTSASLGFTGEVGGSFECAIDTIETWSSCASPQNLTSLAQGGHNFYVRQIDDAGNVGSASARTWVVDTVGPAAPNVLGPAGTVAETEATFTFNTSELPATYSCELDASGPAPCTSPTTRTGLLNGPHSFTITAFDSLGNASAPTTINWTVDTSLFSVAIFGGPVGTVGNADNNFEFAASQTAGTNYFCSIDSEVDFSPCTSTFATGTLADGTHTFRVYATNDSLMNPSATSSASWIIDTLGPSITVGAPLEGATVSSSGQVVFSATDASGSVSTTCKIDSDSATPCNSPAPFFGLESGPHTITIHATDAVGNSSSLVRGFVVDSAAPQTTIVSGPQASTNQTGATITFSSNKPGGTFECMLDGAAVTPCTGSVDFTGLPEGTHIFFVRATDSLGNADPSPASHVWTVDTTAPAAPIVGTPPVDITTAVAEQPIAGFAEQGGVVVVLDGATELGTAVTGSDGVWTLSPAPTLSEGTHNITATVQDAAGNVSEASAIRTILVDSTPPEVAITSPQNDSTLASSSATIEFVMTEANPSAKLCSLNGGTFAPCNSPYVTGTLSETQVHTFSVLAVDTAGNQAVATVNFTVDVTPPTVPTIVSPAAGGVSSTGQLEIVGYTDPAASVTVADGATEVCTATAASDGRYSCPPASPLAEGPHSLTATAEDAVGNLSESSGAVSFTVDTTAPTIQITAPLSTDVVTAASKTTEISFDADDAGTSITVECRLDLGPWTACSSGWTTPVMLDGLRTVTVRVRDAADNVASGFVTFEVDTGAPTATITAGPAPSTTQTSAEFEFTSDDTSASYECRIDGAPYSACQSPFAIIGPLSEGPHSFHLRARDPHDRLSPELVHNWTITPPPPGSGPTPPGGSAGDSDPLPKACFSNGVLITGVTLRGKMLTITGFASARHIGKSVNLTFRPKPRKRVGNAKVLADGRFTARFKAPSRSLRKSRKAAYRASIGKEHSPWAPLASRMTGVKASYSGGRLKVDGALLKPLLANSSVTVRVRIGCAGSFEQVGDADVASSGKFSTSFPFATDSRVIYVRIEGSVARGKRSQKVESLIVPVPVS